MNLLVGLALVGIGAAGAFLLRLDWVSPSPRIVPRLAGAAILVGGVLFAALWLGPARGVFTASVCEPVGALGIVVAGASRRAARAGRGARLAPEPLGGPSRAWRGWLKVALAGPLGMLAAMGIAFCYASWAPGAVQTRLLIAALLVPALWGLAMTWTLADQRILRATGVLTAAIVLGFGLAFAKGVA